MRNLASLVCGLIFGLGLAISGMADPAKVQNFLDVFGIWDPSLAFVMGGAILVTAPGYFFLRSSRNEPFIAEKFHFPSRNDIDAPLLTGAGIFGIGWGLGGFCPGPALAALPMAAPGTFIFVLAMLIGMVLANIARNAGFTPVSV